MADLPRPDSHYRKLENMYHGAAVNQYFRPRLSVSDGEADVVIPVREEFFHPMGAVHGSVYFKALDDAAFFAVQSLVDDVFVLTVSFNLYLMRPVSQGLMRARGRVVQATSKFYVAEATLEDEDSREVARGSGMFMRSRVPLSEEIGYC